MSHDAFQQYTNHSAAEFHLMFSEFTVEAKTLTLPNTKCILLSCHNHVMFVHVNKNVIFLHCAAVKSRCCKLSTEQHSC